MIKLSIDKTSLSNLDREIALKVEAIGYMTQAPFLEEVSRAAFVILGERFMFATDRFSAMNPKRMHHIYEWNKVGKPTARLFVLDRVTMLNGSFITEARFLPSKTPVPIPIELSTRGKGGGYVSKRNVFRDKARIMEKGIEINYVTKNVQVFSDGFEPRFVAPGTRINIKNPGGRFVKDSLAMFMSAWYQKNAQVVMNSSGLYEKIAHEASLALTRKNAGIADMRRITMQVVESVVAGREIIR
jgi:hypothetical protein